MNKRKIIITLIILILIACVGGFGYYYLTKQDKDTTLTILEKKWIEDNKNNVIDLSIVNNIPAFNHDGTGVVFDFINAMESATHLSFNKISYNVGETSPSDYSFLYTSEVTNKDLSFYKDYYGIVSKNERKYNSIEEIETMTIGVLNSDLETVSYNLKENTGLAYKGYDSYQDLFNALNKENPEIQAIAVPILLSMQSVLEGDCYINYHITEMERQLVLRLGSDSKLNTIIKKYTTKWKKDYYNTSFRDHFSNDYFNFNEIYEQAIAGFKGKTYQYGFVDIAPYDSLVDQKLVGINNEIMKRFATLANIEIKFNHYKSVEDLKKAFNENKIDFFMDMSNTDKFDMDVSKMVSAYREKVAIISKIKSDIIIHSFASLKGKKVGVVAGTTISTTLKEYGIEVKEYSNLRSLVESKLEFMVMDASSYEIYNRSLLKNYKLNKTIDMDTDYQFVARSINDNRVFNKYLSFYLTFFDDQEIENQVTYKLFEESITSKLKYYLLAGVVVAIGFVTYLFYNNFKKNRKARKTNVSKENKLKYIDMLTSLKNRNYLNDNMEKWDESEIYPQAIVIVDLNNIAYINDNYGHSEGDNVIRDAANILIRNQIENSEIMRTNGNEFLIYLLAYDEKQVVTYIRKLNKEFKELSHGFGAAMGYSMILDPLKTVDDAINEATLDMRSNKEELNK